MRIDLRPTEQENLARQATAAGYKDVQEYVSEFLRALAQEPTDESLPPLDDEELAASLAICDASKAELEAGGGLTLQEARQRSLSRLRQLTQ